MEFVKIFDQWSCKRNYLAAFALHCRPPQPLPACSPIHRLQLCCGWEGTRSRNDWPAWNPMLPWPSSLRKTTRWVNFREHNCT